MKLIFNLFDGTLIRSLAKFPIDHSTSIASLLLWGICFGTNGEAFARDVCKDVNITITNGTLNKDEIKITKFEYFDKTAGKHRTENLLGLDGREFLNPGKSFTTQRNLQHIHNDLTSFKVSFQRKKINDKKFRNLGETTDVNNFTCINGMSKTVNIR
jgi:hypothetical protein